MRTHCEHGTILLSVIFRIFLGATEKSGTADREPELLHSKGWKQGFPGGSGGKESACSVGDLGPIFGLGRSPGVGNGNTLQYCGLENPMDRGAWWLQSARSERVKHD